MKLDAFQWSSHKTSYKIPVSSRFTCEIMAAGIGEILLVGHHEDGSVILHSDLNRLYIKANFANFEALELRAKEFGAFIKIDGIELGESLDKLPPPAPKPANNLLQKLRNKAIQEMGYRRESFLDNDTGRPGYEDGPGEFEEDELARLQADQGDAPGGNPPQPDEAPANPPADERKEPV